MTCGFVRSLSEIDPRKPGRVILSGTTGTFSRSSGFRQTDIVRLYGTDLHRGLSHQTVTSPYDL